MTSHKIVVTRAGGPDVLQVVEQPMPTPRKGQVVVAVSAAGVAYGDIMRRKGVLAPRHPFTPGYDVVGRVHSIGPSVSDVAIGDRVALLMPRTGSGGYAEHVAVPAKWLVHIPKDMDAAEVVCLGLNYITAYQLLHRVARLERGSRVLIHGAAGGVGTAVLDLGRSLGLEMYGTASARKHDRVRELGGIPIDYRNEDFVERIAELTGDGVDAVFDGVGGDNMRRSYRTLRRGGTLAVYGLSGEVERGLRGVVGWLASYARLKLRPDGKSIRMYMITASRGASRAQCRDDWQALIEMHSKGELAPTIGARVPFRDVAEAHQLIDDAAVAGKVVLICDDT